MWILSFPGQALSLLSRVCINSWALQKTTVLGNCPIITYDLWNANSIHCCRWNIATYEWAIFLNLRNYAHFSPWLVFSKMSCPTLSLSFYGPRTQSDIIPFAYISWKIITWLSTIYLSTFSMTTPTRSILFVIVQYAIVVDGQLKCQYCGIIYGSALL